MNFREFLNEAGYMKPGLTRSMSDVRKDLAKDGDWHKKDTTKKKAVKKTKIK